MDFLKRDINRICRIFIFLVIFIFCKPLNGQHTGYYYKYDFKTYLHTKTKDSQTYLQTIQDSINYLAIARENKFEGKLYFIIVNNGCNESEIILKKLDLKSSLDGVKDSYLLTTAFESEVKLAFKKVDKIWLLDNTEKFMTDFSILFKLEQSDTFSAVEENADIIIVGKPVKIITKTIH